MNYWTLKMEPKTKKIIWGSIFGKRLGLWMAILGNDK